MNSAAVGSGVLERAARLRQRVASRGGAAGTGQGGLASASASSGPVCFAGSSSSGGGGNNRISNNDNNGWTGGDARYYADHASMDPHPGESIPLFADGVGPDELLPRSRAPMAEQQPELPISPLRQTPEKGLRVAAAPTSYYRQHGAHRQQQMLPHLQRQQHQHQHQHQPDFDPAELLPPPAQLSAELEQRVRNRVLRNFRECVREHNRRANRADTEKRALPAQFADVFADRAFFRKFIVQQLRASNAPVRRRRCVVVVAAAAAVCHRVRCCRPAIVRCSCVCVCACVCVSMYFRVVCACVRASVRARGRRS
jgi:hypothetical protein